MSVIVPIYNHAKYLAQCLDSIRDSGYPKIEIVAIDDASTDESAQIVERWRKRNPAVCLTFSRHDLNAGVAATMNETVRAAKGEMICPLASDDLLIPGTLSTRVDYLDAHPDKLAVFGDCEVIDAAGRRLFKSGIEGLYRVTGMRKSLLAIDALVPWLVFFHWSAPGPGILVRRSAYAVVGGYDTTLVAEDWDFYLRLASRNALGFINATVGRYRMHGANTITRDHPRVATDCRVVCERYAKNFGRLGHLRLLVAKVEERYASLKGLARVAASAPRAVFLAGSLLAFRIATRVRAVAHRH